MGIFSKFFGSGDKTSTKNPEVINALKILQDTSLPYPGRAGALTKLKTIFLASSDKADLKIISQLILQTATNDEPMELREIALNTFDTMIESGLQDKLSAVSGYALPKLMEIARYRSEDAKELRQTAFWILSKMAPLGIDDQGLRFLARSLTDKSNNIRMAAVCAFENLVRLGDDGLNRRVARFSLPALCEALNDSTIWVRAAKTLGGLGKYALTAAPFLFRRLDSEEGESAGSALRNITGEQYGNMEKEKWEKWLQESIVK
jgi:hypothetical protein